MRCLERVLGDVVSFDARPTRAVVLERHNAFSRVNQNRLSANPRPRLNIVEPRVTNNETLLQIDVLVPSRTQEQARCGFLTFASISFVVRANVPSVKLRIQLLQALE